MTIELLTPLDSWSDGYLLERLQRVTDEMADRQQQKYELHQEIIRRCQERKANGIPSETFDCSIIRPITYSQAGFTPLLEVFSRADLKTCYEPEHEVTEMARARGMTAKVIALAKRYGEDALKVVEGARVPGNLTVKFEVKKEAANAQP